MQITLLLIVLLLLFIKPSYSLQRYKNFTTCEIFEKNAVFIPTRVVDSLWLIFYFWGNNTELTPVAFHLPAKKNVDKIKEIVDTLDPSLQPKWNTVRLIMEPRLGLQVLFLDAFSPGAFRALIVHDAEQFSKVYPKKRPKIAFADIRMKEVGRYIGMMSCEELTAYALVRRNEVPQTDEECEAAAAQIGYTGFPGKSYLEVKRNQMKQEL